MEQTEPKPLTTFQIVEMIDNKLMPCRDKLLLGIGGIEGAFELECIGAGLTRIMGETCNEIEKIQKVFHDLLDAEKAALPKVENQGR